MWQQPPRRASTRQPAQRIEHLAQAVLALRRVFLHQREVRCHKVPFFLAQITRIRLDFHPIKMGALALVQGKSA